MKTMKKLLVLLLTAGVLIYLLPIGSVTVRAGLLPDYFNISTKYVDADGNTQEAYIYHVKSTDTTWEPITIDLVGVNITINTFAVSSNVTIDERINVEGDMNLILCDGCTLTAARGISVLKGNSLTIYGQTNGTGTLEASSEVSCESGIGGLTVPSEQSTKEVGSITINGGIINATGGNASAGIGGGPTMGCGTVTINRGIVTAIGGDTDSGGAAGIGGGFYNRGNSGTIIINGGVVYADGGYRSTGIGSYPGTADITLNWRNAEDSITANSIMGNVTLARAFAAADRSSGLTAGPADSDTLNNMAPNTMIPAQSITFETTGNGTVKADRPSPAYAPGEIVTLTVMPDRSSALTDGSLKITYTDNGQTVSFTPTAGTTADTYTFTMPQTDVTVSASFEMVPFDITINDMQNGSVTASSETAKMGDIVTLNVTPMSGYVLSDEGLTVMSDNGSIEVNGSDGTYTFTMPAWDVSVSAVFTRSPWWNLQQELNNGGMVKLINNITAVPTDSLLVIPDDVIVTLDLNGFTLDGGFNGMSVIQVENGGELTLSDSSANGNGKVTGGNPQAGGGVYVETGGMFKMSGGYICSNSAANNGGGVYVSEGGTFEMSGGSICSNSAGSKGDAVYNDGGTITLSGTVYAGTASDGTNAGIKLANDVVTGINDCGYLFVTQEPVMSSVQAVLGSLIGMKFYMVIPDAYIDMNGDNSAPGITFTVTDAIGNERTETVQGIKSGFRYMFTFGVNSLEMADTIQATYTYTYEGVTKDITKNITVKDYLSVLINNEAYATAAPLAKAIWNYGYYAQQGLEAGIKHHPMTDDYTYLKDKSVPSPIYRLTEYPITMELGSDVTNASCSLALDSETILNIYLTPAAGTTLTKNNVTVTSSDEVTFTYDVKKSGDRYCVVIKGISAHELGDFFTVTTTGGSSITASALSYVQLVLTAPQIDNKVRFAARGLYAYYDQTIKYKELLTA